MEVRPRARYRINRLLMDRKLLMEIGKGYVRRLEWTSAGIAPVVSLSLDDGRVSSSSCDHLKVFGVNIRVAVTRHVIT